MFGRNIVIFWTQFLLATLVTLTVQQQQRRKPRSSCYQRPNFGVCQNGNEKVEMYIFDRNSEQCRRVFSCTSWRGNSYRTREGCRRTCISPQQAPQGTAASPVAVTPECSTNSPCPSFCQRCIRGRCVNAPKPSRNQNGLFRDDVYSECPDGLPLREISAGVNGPESPKFSPCSGFTCITCHECKVNRYGQPKCVYKDGCCPPRRSPANCLVNPCRTGKTDCPSASSCVAIYCGSCRRKFYNDDLEEIPESQCTSKLLDRFRDPASIGLDYPDPFNEFPGNHEHSKNSSNPAGYGADSDQGQRSHETSETGSYGSPEGQQPSSTEGLGQGPSFAGSSSGDDCNRSNCPPGTVCESVTNGVAMCKPVPDDTAPGGSFGVNPCLLPKISGNCLAYIPSWHYDQASGACEEFVYGGCGGNGNRFETKEECLQQCGQTHSTDGSFNQQYGSSGTNQQTTSGYEDSTQQTQLSSSGFYGEDGHYANVGNGEQNTARPTESGGGVKSDGQSEYGNTAEQGNSHNGTIKGQGSSGTGGKSELPLCQQPKKTGDCRGHFPSFFYNKDSGACESFVYGGCKGNENRFETKTQCEKKCSKNHEEGTESDQAYGASEAFSTTSSGSNSPDFSQYGGFETLGPEYGGTEGVNQPNNGHTGKYESGSSAQENQQPKTTESGYNSNPVAKFGPRRSGHGTQTAGRSGGTAESDTGPQPVKPWETDSTEALGGVEQVQGQLSETTESRWEGTQHLQPGPDLHGSGSQQGEMEVDSGKQIDVGTPGVSLQNNRKPQEDGASSSGWETQESETRGINIGVSHDDSSEYASDDGGQSRRPIQININVNVAPLQTRMWGGRKSHERGSTTENSGISGGSESSGGSRRRQRGCRKQQTQGCSQNQDGN